MTPRSALELLGDSHLARLDVRQVAQLEAELESLRPAAWQVRNAATGGSSGVHLRMRCGLAMQVPASAFVVSVGTNDAASWKRVPLDAFSVDLTAAVTALGAHRTVVVGAPPVDEARHRPGQVRRNTEVAQYARAARDVAAATGAVFLDSAAALRACAPEMIHDDDGVHLSGAGCTALLRGIARAVGQLPAVADAEGAPLTTALVEAVRACCALLEQPGAVDADVVARRVVSALARLVAAVTDLPDAGAGAGADDDAADVLSAFDVDGQQWQVVYRRVGEVLGPYSGYYQEANRPFDVGGPQSTSLGDLADDLADIWRDLAPGLLALDAGVSPRDVVEDWRTSYRVHWGYHATSALGVLVLHVTGADGGGRRGT